MNDTQKVQRLLKDVEFINNCMNTQSNSLLKKYELECEKQEKQQELTQILQKYNLEQQIKMVSYYSNI